MLNTVIFDFDYTLGDSTKGICLSINYALQQMGYPIASPEEIACTIGLSLKETFITLTSVDTASEIVKFSSLFKEMADRVMVAHTNLYEGVLESLHGLKEKGVKLAIVTSKYHYRIEQILSKFSAGDLIDIIVGAEDVKFEKPSPEGLLRAIETLQVNAEEVLYVGDSIVDAQAAQNANVKFAATLTGTTTRDELGKYRSVFMGNSVVDIYHFVIDGLQ